MKKRKLTMEHLHNFGEYLRTEEKSEATCEKYLRDVRAFFAFAVDDVAACARLVEQAGYEVFVQPKSVNIGGDENFPAEVAFCKGPLGEEIEFFCQKWQS